MTADHDERDLPDWAQEQLRRQCEKIRLLEQEIARLRGELDLTERVTEAEQ